MNDMTDLSDENRGLNQKQEFLTFVSTTGEKHDEEQHAIQGTVEKIVYENADTGFLVGRLQEEGSNETVTFVGYFLAVSPGDYMRLWGHWEMNPKYGREFRVDKFETLIPSSRDAIEKYLGSGLIHGIGKGFARRIVQHFGVDTLRIIDENPRRLNEVPGIGEKRALQIRKAWETQKHIQSIMMFLQGHGIGVNHAIRIYKRYGDKAITVLRENPYRLAEEVIGIAFKTADAIASSLGIAKDSLSRILAGMRYVLDQAASEGNVFLPKEELKARTANLLEVEPILVENAIPEAVNQRAIIQDSDAIYLPYLYTAETGVANLLSVLATNFVQQLTIDIEKAIAWVEKRNALKLSEEQQQAIRLALNNKILLITGGPGTGKTTIIRSITDILECKGLKVALAAPTGRAAKRMTLATGREAKTIHRLLEFSPHNGRFQRNETNPLKVDLVVIDESSMIDIGLMYHLLQAIPAEARVIFVGDVDQLPSVGPGLVLFDMIGSNTLPVVRLHTIFRQASQSGIVLNAHRINQGKFPEFNTRDFVFIERTEPEHAQATIIEIVTRRLPKSTGFDPKKEIQVLTPLHRGVAGVKALNIELQKILTPDTQTITGTGFFLGDKVMQQRNNYELDVYNGDVGVITAYDEDQKVLTIEFDDRTVCYPWENVDELELAYASTVHKAQGSEYPAIVMPVLSQHHIMLQRNILYTAVTRASQLVVLVGTRKAIYTAITNTKSVRRYSRLVDRLRKSIPLRE